MSFDIVAEPPNPKYDKFIAALGGLETAGSLNSIVVIGGRDYFDNDDDYLRPGEYSDVNPKLRKMFSGKKCKKCILGSGENDTTIDNIADPDFSIEITRVDVADDGLSDVSDVSNTTTTDFSIAGGFVDVSVSADMLTNDSSDTAITTEFML